MHIIVSAADSSEVLRRNSRVTEFLQPLPFSSLFWSCKPLYLYSRFLLINVLIFCCCLFSVKLLVSPMFTKFSFPTKFVLTFEFSIVLNSKHIQCLLCVLGLNHSSCLIEIPRCQKLHCIKLMRY